MSRRVPLRGGDPTGWPHDPQAEGDGQAVRHVPPPLRFGVTVGIYCLVFTLLLVCLGSYPPVFQRLVGGTQEMMKYHQELLLEFTGFVLSHWWIPLLACLVMGCASIIYSYRIFASMKQFEEALRLKQQDPFCQVSLELSKSDYFHHFAGLLEEVLNAPVPSPTPAPPAAREEPRMELVKQS